MKIDRVDNLLTQWENERPELDPESLGLVLRIQILAKSLRRQAGRALAPLDLSMWEYDVLSALRRQGPPYRLSASELARESMLSSGAMTNRIDRLEEQGLVRRLSDPDDRRGVPVGLTKAGRDLVNDAVTARVESAQASLADITDTDRRSLDRLLRRLMESVS